MLAKTAGTARFCYNWGLAKWKEMHARGEHCDQYLLSRLWTKEKPEWAKETYRNAQTKALLNLGGAFRMFFQKKAGFPKFHKKYAHDAFYLDNGKGYVRGAMLHIPNIGKVRMAEELRYSSKVLHYTISRKADKWYVSITVQLQKNNQCADNSSVIGVDVGSKHWAVSSEGDILDKPTVIPKLVQRLKHYQRVMSRRQKGSSNRNKARIKVARIYKRIQDVKLDAVHKFTSRIAKNHGVVCCEDLNVEGMRTGLKATRCAVQNSCMFELRRQLSYKAKHYVEIGLFYPSSKRCSKCGENKDDLTINDRTFHCQHCGRVIDRDLNAAINIRDEGLRIFTEGHSGSACGGC